MESIEKKYEDAFEQLAGIQPIFPEQAKRQMAEMVEIIAKANENIRYRLNTNQKIGQKGGFIIEEAATETYNLDAAYKNDSSRAITDRYKQEWKNQGLKGNDNPDIVIVKDDKVIYKAQSKFDKTPKKTAGQFSQINADKTVKYGDMDAYLAPEDQVQDIKDYSARVSAEKGRQGDKALEESFRQTKQKVTDKIEKNGIKSREFSKKDADDFGSGDLKKLKDIESEYQTKSTLKQMGNAAVGAAAMSAVISGSINTIKYVQLAREGKLTVEEATLKIVGETVASAADSAVKASANTGVQSLIVRYGGEKAATEILANQGLKTMLKGNAVTVGVVCAVDMVKDLVLLGTDRITKEQFYERQGKGVLNTAAGTVGATLGTAATGGMAAIFGLEAGAALTALSVVGGLSGGLIAGLAMSFAIENGIERPYRDLLRNTQSLNETAYVLERVSQNVFKGQILFTKYLEADRKMEKDMQIQMGKVDEAGKRALDAINLI